MNSLHRCQKLTISYNPFVASSARCEKSVILTNEIFLYTFFVKSKFSLELIFVMFLFANLKPIHIKSGSESFTRWLAPLLPSHSCALEGFKGRCEDARYVKM